MIETVYIEEEIQEHPRVTEFLKSSSCKRVIPIARYTEIFNRKAQNFRLQKEKPALIIAKKYGSYLQEIPAKFGIGGTANYYFSHILNCPFDCKYCFLQGMYRSAHYVWFINYEDFQNAIVEKMKEEKREVYFFSGYDGDSLALEAKTHFAKEFLSFFEANPKAILELRTKSLFIKPLLTRNPFPNCIAAYTLSPAEIAKKIEIKAPPLAKRLQALQDLQKRGWTVGLRFDPLLFVPNFEELYAKFFSEVFQKIDPKKVHSATIGAFRLPKTFYDNMAKAGVERKLLSVITEQEDSAYSYAKEQQEKMTSFCKEQIEKHIEGVKIFTI